MQDQCCTFNMTHLLALQAGANSIVNSWDGSACCFSACCSCAGPKLKPIDGRPVLYLHYRMDPRWLEKMTIHKQIFVLNMSTAHCLLTAKNVDGDGNCYLHALVQTRKSCNPGKRAPWHGIQNSGGYLHDTYALRKALVEEMREAPQKDPNDDRMSGYNAKKWGQMCDQFSEIADPIFWPLQQRMPIFG